MGLTSVSVPTRSVPKESRRPLLSTLNFDIFLHLILFLSTRDLSVLTRTCRILRECLLLELIRRPVVLTSDNTESFSELMHEGLTDGTHGRVLSLHTLSVYPCRGGSPLGLSPIQMAHAIEGFLSCASNLTTLSITDVYLTFSPRQLRSILARLPALRQLILKCLTHVYQPIADIVQSALQRLALYPAGASPWTGLPRHCASITHLALGGFVPLPDASFPPMPQVEVLTLGQLSSSGDSAGAGNSWGCVLMRLFPNARRVRIAALYRGNSSVFSLVRRHSTASSMAADLLEWRMQSKRFASEHSGWRRLDFLEVGSFPDLYYLGLSCELRHLEIGTLSGCAVPAHITDAVEDVRPAHLGCGVPCESLTEHLPALWQAIYTTCSVHRLALDLADNERILFPLQGLQEVLEVFSAQQGVVSVTHLFLGITTAQLARFASRGATATAAAVAGAPLGTPSFQCPDPITFVRAVADSITSAQWIFLDISGPAGGGGVRAWSSAGTRGGRWYELGRTEARRALAEEDMLLIDNGW